MTEYRVFAPVVEEAVAAGGDIAALILRTCPEPLEDGDILVIAHKIVSKAEGRLVALDSLTASPRAEQLGRFLGKDPRLIELILSESREVLYAERESGPLICLHRLGYVCANAAVDCSNAREGCAIALPADPDASAARIRASLEKAAGVRLGVLICDTHGRSFREGAVGVTVGASGVRVMRSYIGETDLAGRTLQSSVECWADELSAAATLVMGQAGESRPYAVLRGFADALGEQTAADIPREEERDIFLQALRKCRAQEQA